LAPRVRAIASASRADRTATLPGPHAEASFGPLVHAPWAAHAEPPSRSYPLAPHVAHARAGCTDHAARPMPLPPYRGHVTAHAAACCLGAQEVLPTALSLAIKAGHSPSRAGAQRYQAAIAAVLVPTVNPWLWPLAPPSCVAHTSPRTPRNFSLRLLPRLSHLLAGETAPAVAAA
jgi:hypothetical protein